MRTLREIWDDPNTWRLTSDGSCLGTGCGCILGEVVFWGLVALLWAVFRR